MDLIYVGERIAYAWEFFPTPFIDKQSLLYHLCIDVQTWFELLKGDTSSVHKEFSLFLLLDEWQDMA